MSTDDPTELERAAEKLMLAAKAQWERARAGRLAREAEAEETNNETK